MTAVPSQSTLPESGVRVRFAPSPTGSLHIGGAKTAMFTWLFAHGEARRQGKDGVFILRIEDTDRNRFVPGAEEGLIDALHWFGLTWDEGPDVGGPVGPYHQSERTEHYRQAAEHLIDTGYAYRCYCTRDRLERVRAEQQARGEAPGYDRHCRNVSPDEKAAREAGDEPYVVRFAMPREGETVVHDLIRGPITYQNANLEDLVLLKSDGYPTYHLANVVDDHLMRITHITRGDEWIPTAPVHTLLYQAFGWEMPAIAHLPLILAPGGGKLSKRHGSTAVEEFRAQGYVPEALMNYLALLGWSFDASTEIFPPDELLAKFTLERVSPSPATFDYNKLRWFNQQYINHVLTLDDVAGRVIPFLVDAGLIPAGPADAAHPDFARVRDVVELLKDRLETLADAPDLMRFFLRDELDPYDTALLIPKKMDLQETLDALIAAEAALAEADLSDEAATEARMRALAEELGLKPGQLFMAIRVAVTGRTQSPGLFETLRVIGKERCQSRIASAMTRLRQHGDEVLSAD
ncbi:MAG TPA: glutamate--tRNA ligase [Thermomicrobiales bacterium]|nr:glutamate--tRNA ligase [Thermomicrobiales bacterium]